MSDRWEAPAKINLSLLVRPPDRTGMHPIRSLVQTIDRLDLLDVETGDDEALEIEGDELSNGEDNLVWKAVRTLVGRPDRPRLVMRLHKTIPAAAGLGGGSADAAAALCAAARVYGRAHDQVVLAAPRVGADVPYFLQGGTRWMEGYGETLTEVEPLAGFCVVVAVPPIEMPTPAVYRRWDDMDGPLDDEFPSRALPPVLRSHGPVRNDLAPAARSLRPELGDWAVDLAERWERPVSMTGSGSAHFGFFADLDEATAAAAIDVGARSVFPAALRGTGVEAR